MKSILKKLSTLLVLSLVVLSQSSCASRSAADETERNYEIGSFSQLYLKGNFRIVLEQAKQPGLRIQANEGAFDDLVVDLDSFSNQLRITREKIDFQRPVLYIRFVDLENIHIEGGVKLETKGYVDLSEFHLRVDGGATLRMQVKADYIGVTGSGGVNFVFEGVTDYFQALISGVGYLDAGNLQASHADIEIEGGGFALVNASNTLKATVEGVGKIRYKGHPQVDERVEGLGSITRE